MLRIGQAYSGHGPLIENPLATIDAARKGYEKWLTVPEKVSWHAIKRIFSFTLINKFLCKNQNEKEVLNGNFSGVIL